MKSDSGNQRLTGPKKMLFTAVSFVLVCLLFASLEYLVRAVQARRYGGGTLTPLALADRFVAWRINPAYRRVDIQHNAQGFRRAASTSLEKPPNTIRIFLLGGSTAWGAQGSFSDIDNRYSRIYNNQLIDAYLEQKLSAAVPSRHWEVINAAASGYRIHQHLTLLESRILRYRPDCVILLDGYNDFMTLFHTAAVGGQSDFDIYESTAGREEFDAIYNSRSFSSLLAFSHNWMRSNSALIRLAEDRVPGLVRNPWRGAPRNQLASANPATLSDLEHKGADWALREASFFPRVARQIFRIANLDGSVPIFLLQPILILSHKQFTTVEKQMFDYDRTSGGPLYAYLFPETYRRLAGQMSEAAQMDGFPFVNLDTVFDGSADQTFTDFAHLTPRGNEIIAERLVPLILEKFPQAGK